VELLLDETLFWIYNDTLLIATVFSIYEYAEWLHVTQGSHDLSDTECGNGLASEHKQPNKKWLNGGGF
jgi:hypothetical protein